MQRAERDQRNAEIYEYLTTPDAEGYCPSYKACAAHFGLTPKWVTRLFRAEWESRDDGKEEPLVRWGRPEDSLDAFLQKYGAVVEALCSGTPAKHILQAHDLSKSTLYWIRARAVEFGLLTTPAKEIRPKKHALPASVSALRHDGFIEIALDSPEAKKALASFFGTGA